MLTNAIPANATALLIAKSQPTQSASIEEAADADCVISLAAWAASIGRTAADVAALMFALPMPARLRSIFEDTIRHEANAALHGEPAIPDGECPRLEDIAWLAFDRLSMRTANQ